MNRVFIGMPVYNGERFIARALDSLREQTYLNWSLLISDNSSADKTSQICNQYCAIDDRIKYIRQDVNIGAPGNFKYLLDKAESEYFMWASSDDTWHPDFLTSAVNLLDDNKDIGMAFCNIVNIDSFDRVIRNYPSFKSFTDSNNIRRVYKYLRSPEILGKANLIYSVYRLDFCRKAWTFSPLSDEWGSDMCFVLAAICRSDLCIEDKILFQKRIARQSDQPEFISKIEIKNPNRYIFPLNKSIVYIKNNVRAVKGSNYSFITLTIMIFRIPLSLLNFCINAISHIKRLK